jgi:hypothetical protein
MLKGMKEGVPNIKVASVKRFPNMLIEADHRIVQYKLRFLGKVINGTKYLVDCSITPGNSKTYRPGCPFEWLDSRVINKLISHNPIGDFCLYAFKEELPDAETYDLFEENYFGLPNPIINAIHPPCAYIYELFPEEQSMIKDIYGRPYSQNDSYYKDQDHDEDGHTKNYYGLYGGYYNNNLKHFQDSYEKGPAYLISSLVIEQLMGEPKDDNLFDWLDNDTNTSED